MPPLVESKALKANPGELKKFNPIQLLQLTLPTNLALLMQQTLLLPDPGEEGEEPLPPDRQLQNQQVLKPHAVQLQLQKQVLNQPQPDGVSQLQQSSCC